MRSAWFAFVVLAGCSFREGLKPSGDGGKDIDASEQDTDAKEIDAKEIDGPPPCTAGFLDLCAIPPAGSPLDITQNTTINTDTSSMCTPVTQAGGRTVCLLDGSSVSISAGVTLTAIGMRPLAIRSDSTMTIDGTIDVSSYRGNSNTGAAANDPSCAFLSNPTNANGGGGGGAGGSFGTAGGAGGTGNTDSSVMSPMAPGGTPGAAATVTILRGGCPGQNGGTGDQNGGDGGAGGASGGAVYLVAKTQLDITATGRIRATGAGATGSQVQGGGGGGGTGGMIVLESPTLNIAGSVTANGGSGSEGGAYDGFGNPHGGAEGNDGTYGTGAVVGGSSGSSSLSTMFMGDGGGGGAAAAAAGVGEDSKGGAGGGGGAVGVVRMIGTRNVTGIVSPAAP